LQRVYLNTDQDENSSAEKITFFSGVEKITFFSLMVDWALLPTTARWEGSSDKLKKETRQF
jgi:hypothetical protein